jgi:hypothetical protein
MNNKQHDAETGRFHRTCNASTKVGISWLAVSPTFVVVVEDKRERRVWVRKKGVVPEKARTKKHGKMNHP